MDFKVKNQEKSDFQKLILKYVGVKWFKIRPELVVRNALGRLKLISISKMIRPFSQNQMLKIHLIFCKKSSKIENLSPGYVRYNLKNCKNWVPIKILFFCAQTTSKLSREPLARSWDAFLMILLNIENPSEIIDFP